MKQRLKTKKRKTKDPHLIGWFCFNKDMLPFGGGQFSFLGKSCQSALAVVPIPLGARPFHSVPVNSWLQPQRLFFERACHEAEACSWKRFFFFFCFCLFPKVYEVHIYLTTLNVLCYNSYLRISGFNSQCCMGSAVCLCASQFKVVSYLSLCFWSTNRLFPGELAHFFIES